MKLIVIDMQKALLVSDLYNLESIKKNILKLVNKARKEEVEVIFIKHDGGSNSGFTYGDLGFELWSELDVKKDEKVFVKTINSAFGNPDYVKYLETSGDKDLMIVGLQTDFCIDATIKSAFERGYNVYIPNNTNSTFDNNIISARTTYNFYNKWVWPDTFGKCITLSSALKMLERK